MKPLHILLLLCLCLGGYGQSVWNKTYIADRPTFLFSSVVSINSIYYVSGVTTEYGLPYPRIIMTKIDELGNGISYKSVYDSTVKIYGAFYNALIRNDKNELLYAGYSGDSIPRLLLLKQNLSDDSITVYEYTTPNSYAYAGYTILQSGSDYFVAGVQTDLTTNNANNVLLKVDSNGNMVWQKYYNQRKQDYVKSIIQLDPSNLLLGCVRNDVNQTVEHANTWLLQVDTGGNFVRQWFDPSDSTYAAEGLKQTQDGGFIYGAQKKFEQTVNDVFKTATIVKMDYNFNKQWVFEGGISGALTGFTDIEELPDGSFVACGKKNYRLAWIVKLNATGQVIWDKTYVGITTSGSENYLTDIDVLPDGSLIAVGQCQLSGAIPPQVGWFLKLDSNGCEIENCLVGIDEPQAQQLETLPLHLYPNPATTSITIDYGFTDWSKAGELSLEITNQLGRTVYSQALPAYSGFQKINIATFAGGMYQVFIKRGTQTIAVGKFAKQ